MKSKIIMMMTLCTVLSACSSKNTGKLTEEQVDDLMLQYVQEMECDYEEYLPNVWVASCKVFGDERDDDTDMGYVYAYVLDEEYVKFKDVAYDQSGGYCPVKIKVKFEGDNIKYLDSEFPADGSAYQDSLREMFPLKYYLACEIYDPFDRNGNPKLEKQQEEKIKAIWGVETAKEESLHISEDGSYEIVWTTCDGPEEEFEVHVKESGKLGSQANNSK